MYIYIYYILHLCLKGSPAHQSTNPARPGLTSELVCLLSLFSTKTSYPLVLSRHMYQLGTYFLVGVANWKCWDADWWQIDILGRWLVANRHSLDADWSVRCTRSTFLKVSHGEFMVKYEIMVLACQVGPFHLKLTVNSEMNCIPKYKCTVSQKLDS